VQNGYLQRVSKQFIELTVNRSCSGQLALDRFFDAGVIKRGGPETLMPKDPHIEL
jgi:hypothetical protein